MSRRERKARLRSWAAAGTLLAAIAALCGCIVDSAGRPFGAHAAESLAKSLHVAASRHTRSIGVSRGGYCSEAGCENERRARAEGPSECLSSSEPAIIDSEAHVEPWPQPNDLPNAVTADGKPAHPHHGGLQSLPLGALGTLLSAASIPAAAVGGIAHAFFPAEIIGPPELPPPSRFHPVPTRPVFAPQDRQLVELAPSGA